MRRMIGITTVLLALLVWWLLSLNHVIDAARFPPPHEVWSQFIVVSTMGYGNGLLHNHILHSLGLVAKGFVRRGGNWCTARDADGL